VILVEEFAMSSFVELLRFILRKIIGLHIVLIKQYDWIQFSEIGVVKFVGFVAGIASATITALAVSEADISLSYKLMLFPISIWVGFFAPIFVWYPLVYIAAHMWRISWEIYYFAYPEGRDKQKREGEEISQTEVEYASYISADVTDEAVAKSQQ
jgi:hypothetical protein